MEGLVAYASSDESDYGHQHQEQEQQDKTNNNHRKEQESEAELSLDRYEDEDQDEEVQKQRVLNAHSGISRKRSLSIEETEKEGKMKESTRMMIFSECEIEGQEEVKKGECNPELQMKFEKWHHLMTKGLYFNHRLEKTHAFRNPSIMSKLIEFLDLDEIGSNFDKNIFDPHGFESRGYYENISNEQIEMTRAKEIGLTTSSLAGTSGISSSNNINTTASNNVEVTRGSLSRAIQFQKRSHVP